MNAKQAFWFYIGVAVLGILCGLTSCTVVDPHVVDGACNHLRMLHCKLAEPTPNGHTCEEWLTNALEEHAPIDAACLAKAPSCEAASGCTK